MDTTAAPEQSTAEAPAQIEWTYNPWRDARGWRHPAVALLLELGLAALAGYAMTAPDWWPAILRWGGVSIVFLLAATASLFLPVRYRLDERGVTVWFLSVPSSRPWGHYRNYYAHETGVHLTTMPKPSALDPFRGHFLLFSGNRSAVITKVRYEIEARINQKPEPEKIL